MIFTKDKSFYKTLFSLSAPIALQNLINFGVTFADSVMISSLGDVAVSGVYMANQIQTLLFFLSSGIEGIILVLGSQYRGEKDTESIRKILSEGIKIAFLFALILNAVCFFFPSFVLSLFTNSNSVAESGKEYLSTVCFSYTFFVLTQSLIASQRCVENARVGLLVSFISLITNISANRLLIFGDLGFPKLGIHGAAIATLFSRVTEFSVILIYTLVKDKKLKFRLSDIFKFDKQIFDSFIHTGIPIITGQLVWATNNLMSSAIMGRYMQKEVIASLGVANAMSNLYYVPVNAISCATGIITGKTVGKNDFKKMKEYAKTVQIICLFLSVLTFFSIQLIKNPFISLWQISESAVSQAKTMIDVLSFVAIGTCYSTPSLFGLIKSGGDVNFVLKNEMIFVFLIILPSALISSRLGAPSWIVFAFLQSDKVLKCPVAALKINCGNWMKNLTLKNKYRKKQNKNY